MNPPHSPTIRKRRLYSPGARTAKAPIRIEPVIFTATVSHGKVEAAAGKRRAERMPAQYLAAPPSALPSATIKVLRSTGLPALSLPPRADNTFVSHGRR